MSENIDNVETVTVAELRMATEVAIRACHPNHVNDTSAEYAREYVAMGLQILQIEATRGMADLLDGIDSRLAGSTTDDGTLLVEVTQK